MSWAFNFAIEEVAFGERGLGMAASIPYGMNGIAAPEQRYPLSFDFDDDASSVRKISDRCDLGPHHTLPSSWAVSYLRLIHVLTAGLSSGCGSLASASSKNPRT